MKLANKFSAFWKAVMDLILPERFCVSCFHPRNAVNDFFLCENCQEHLEKSKIIKDVCPRCLRRKKASDACSFCQKGGLDGIDACYSPFFYEGIVRKLIYSLKFKSIENAALMLAKEMQKSIAGIEFDVIVPVPLSKKHLQERGKNQTLILAELLSPDKIVDCLQKSKYAKQQSLLKSEEKRIENIKNAFAFKKEYLQILNNKTILLVDDIRTSGATARECAKILKSNGAKAVYLLTAAIA